MKRTAAKTVVVFDVAPREVIDRLSSVVIRSVAVLLDIIARGWSGAVPWAMVRDKKNSRVGFPLSASNGTAEDMVLAGDMKRGFQLPVRLRGG